MYNKHARKRVVVECSAKPSQGLAEYSTTTDSGCTFVLTLILFYFLLQLKEKIAELKQIAENKRTKRGELHGSGTVLGTGTEPSLTASTIEAQNIYLTIDEAVEEDETQHEPIDVISGDQALPL